MAIDLSGYRAIQVAYFVELNIVGYNILRFSDYNKTISIDGSSYTNIGSLLSVSSSRSEVRALQQEITVGISGIPAGSVAEILIYNPKGSAITVRQAFFDPITDTLLAITGNPAIKFKGVVNNFNMVEEWDNASKTTTFSIVLSCNSLISNILNKVSGRRTNDSDQQFWAPGDLSMSRVSTITKTNFQFGKAPDAAAGE